MPEKDKDGVRVIHKSGEHLLALINDVLDLAKLEAGKIEFCVRDVHLAATLETVKNLCEVRATQKGLAFTFEQRGSVLHSVRVDEKRLTQVILNLLDNAIKFTARGTVTLRAITLEEPEPGWRAVRFEVEDTGPGIAPEDMERIFRPFGQNAEQATRLEGTGLGLSITRRIVEQIGGNIAVRSQLGRGSLFAVTLRLPAVHAVVSAADTTLSWQEIGGYEGERRAILVVDDNLDNRATLRDLLLPIGFELMEVTSATSAMQLAADRVPALIVMSLAVPGMNGRETARRLRQLPTLEKTVLIASSLALSEAERPQMHTDCDDFLPMPVQAGTLLGIVQRHLGLSWIRREGPAPMSREDSERAKLTLPPARDVARLLDLATRGRVRHLLDELTQIEVNRPEVGRWSGQVRTLVQRFQMKELGELLRAQADAAPQSSDKPLSSPPSS